MKIAVVSESPADEAAIKVILEAIVGSEFDLLPLRTRPHGWTTVFELLLKIIPALHYGYPDVEALVVVIDSDETPPHEKSHEGTEIQNPECRLCRLRLTVQTALANVRPIPGRMPLKTALGLAVPAVEAWYRAGIDPHVNEVAWRRKLTGEDVSYDKRSLKRDTYGTERPTLTMETVAAVAAAQRITHDIDALQQLFPDGFGSLLRDLRRW